MVKDSDYKLINHALELSSQAEGYKDLNTKLRSVSKEINNENPLGLDYSDFFHSQWAGKVLGGFNGKSVLELGGALSSTYVTEFLKPRKWIALEKSTYKLNQINNYSFIPNKENYFYESCGWKEFFAQWRKYKGKKFDIIYSISAFEHIEDLGSCLNSCYEMLNSGGMIYSKFSPIWSASNGSHNFHPPEINILGPHSHLLFNFSSLQEHLIEKFNVNKLEALIKAELLYKSSQINRYTFEDYIKIFDNNKFSEKITLIADRAIKFKDIYEEELCKKIRSNYPNMEISCSGFELLFRK